MTCKDCVHYETCLESAKAYDEGVSDFENDGIEEFCRFAKPKSRFVELPCEVGQEVYTNVFMRGWYFRQNDKPYTAKIVFIGLNNYEEMGGGFFNVLYEKNDYMFSFKFSDIGKTVFLSKEAAENALKERKVK